MNLAKMLKKNKGNFRLLQPQQLIDLRVKD